MKFIINFLKKLDKINILDLIFPPSCIICGKLRVNYICEKCEKRFERNAKFNIIDNQKLIKDKLGIRDENFVQKSYEVGEEEIFWEKMMYCFDYKSAVRKYMLKYKFNDEAYISNFFAKQILKNKKAYDFFQNYDIIIPVPMDKEKRLERGYNQTELITSIIAENSSIKEFKILEKVKKTKTQSLLEAEERKANIRNVFLIKNKELVKNKNIILFDDIYTTGATVNEIAKILKNAGANKILVLVIAKN